MIYVLSKNYIGMPGLPLHL